MLALTGALACGGIVRIDGEARGGAGGGDGSNDATGASSRNGLGQNAAGNGTGDSADSMGGVGNDATGSGAHATGTGGHAATGGSSVTPGGGDAWGSGGSPTTGGTLPVGGWTGAGGTAQPACSGISFQSESVVVSPDMLILLDRSQSMSCSVPGGEDRWTAVKTGIAAFLMQPSAVGRSVGIEYFEPEESADAGTSCNAIDYQTPDVDVASLPQNAEPIVESLARHSPGGHTPTAAALIGAYDHLVNWQATHQGNQPVVVLVTDGEPDACGSVADVAHAVSVGAQSGIETFVIGLLDSGNSCNLDPNPANQKDLDTIARSGGSASAFIVDLQSGIEAELLKALGSFQLTAPPACHYELPPSSPVFTVNPSKIDVTYTSSGSTSPTTVPPVAGVAACDPKLGGYYLDDPSNPTKIDLCPATCDTIDAAQASVSIDLGCPAEGL